MIDITLKEIRNVFIATIDLLIKPKSCFTKEHNGDLSVASITGFKYWFYLTLLTYILLLMSSSSANYYSTWYFVSSGIYVLLRMLFIALIWVIVGKLLNFSNIKHLISLLFFQVALFSFLIFILLFPLVYTIGLETLLSPDRMLVQEIIREERKYIFYVVGIYSFLIMFYSITWISSVFNKSKFIVIVFLLSTFFFYGMSREYIIVPMIDFFQDYLYRIPWVSDSNITA